MTASADDHVVYGAKVATIIANPAYPIVSAFEFEFLQEEAVFRERMDKCTVYLIVQRPLTYFDNVRMNDFYIYLDIVDGQQAPLQCRINLVENAICEVDEPVDIEVQFFSKNPGREQPLRDVGALKLYRRDGSFILWWSPQKLLYEMIVNNLKVGTIGDPTAFLDFRVLYIGQAFSQKVWDRLAGHRKMKRILTLEGPIGASPEARAPFEISLILLRATDFDEVIEVPHTFMPGQEGIEPILHPIDLDQDGALEAFWQPFIEMGDEALTRDLEAQLIRYFRPPYNEVMFDNYPDIAGGMRSKGYSWSEIEVDGLPASLSTVHGAMNATFNIEG
jgi:hypothetical protein